MLISKRILIKIRTFKSVEGVVTTYQEVWETVVGFQNVHNSFKLHLGKLIEAVPADMLNTVGTTSEKTKVQKETIDLGVDILDLLFVTATIMDNEDLLANVKILHKEIYFAPDEEFVGVCKNIHLLGTNNLEAAQTYGLTQGKLAIFKTSYEKFEELISEVLNEETVNSEAYQTIVFHTNECSKDLIMMKKMMSNFKNVHNFYDSFFDAAKYEKFGFHKLSYSGYLINQATNKPVANASIVLTDNSEIEIHVKSSASGKITIRHQPENIYYMSIIKVGLQPIVGKQVLIEDGLTNEDEIYMEPLV